MPHNIFTKEPNLFDVFSHPSFLFSVDLLKLLGVFLAFLKLRFQTIRILGQQSNVLFVFLIDLVNFVS